MTPSTDVIMPVLGMSQDSGRLVRWIKQAGERVEKGEPLMEVETDKATVEIEAPASGILTQVSVQAGEEVPVTQVMAVIQATGEAGAVSRLPLAVERTDPAPAQPAAPVSISPVALRIVNEHHLDIGAIHHAGARIEKKDVLEYLASGQKTIAEPAPAAAVILASPKARRLAAERGIDLASVTGHGPDGAILVEDLPPARTEPAPAAPAPAFSAAVSPENELPVSLAWSRMIERISASWPATPHFYLMREVRANRLLDWKESLQAHSDVKITITDLLVKLAAVALVRYPRVNAGYRDGKLYAGAQVNIGIAVAVEDGLLVPVIRGADTLRLSEIAAARIGLIERARAGKLRPDDLQGGTFTISNLGMYGVDAFNAMVNPGQAAILAVGRIADRVVAVNGQAVVRSVMVLSMSYDHRVVDGARGALFLQTLSGFVEEPLSLLD